MTIGTQVLWVILGLDGWLLGALLTQQLRCHLVCWPAREVRPCNCASQGWTSNIVVSWPVRLVTLLLAVWKMKRKRKERR